MGRFQSSETVRLKTSHFWILVMMVYGLSYVPYLGVPFKFLATWAHEWGHGIGAQISGGRFLKFVVNPDFSGVATTTYITPFQRFMTLITGLLAPSIVGGFLLILTRRFRAGKFVLGLLACGLILTGLIWAGNAFTRLSLLGFALVFGLLAWKASARVGFYLALIVSIAICLNAVAMIDYFFMTGARIGGVPMQTDVSALTEILGGFPWLWGLILTAMSFSILYVAFKLSEDKKPQASTTA